MRLPFFRWIKTQEEELGLESSVSQDEIQSCLDEAKRIEDLLARQNEGEINQKLFIYKEEAPLTNISDDVDVQAPSS